MDSMFWLFKQLVGVVVALVLIGPALAVLAFLFALLRDGLASVVRTIRDGSGSDEQIRREEAERRERLGYGKE